MYKDESASATNNIGNGCVVCNGYVSAQPCVIHPFNHASSIPSTTSKVLVKCSTIVLVPLPLGPMGVFHAKHLVSTTASSKDTDPPFARNGAIVCMVSPASVAVLIRQCHLSMSSGALCEI